MNACKNTENLSAFVTQLSDAFKQMNAAAIHSKEAVNLFSDAARKIDHASQNCWTDLNKCYKHN